MHLLTVLAPFILGIVIQVSAILGGVLAAPPDDHHQDTRIQRDDFAYRLDIATFAPSFLTLLGAALLNRGEIPDVIVAIIIITAITLFFALLIVLIRTDPTSYAAKTDRRHGLTPLNVWVIAANVVLGITTVIATIATDDNSGDKPETQAASSVVPIAQFADLILQRPTSRATGLGDAA